MSFLTDSMILKGNRQVLMKPLTSESGTSYTENEAFLIPYPQLMSITDDQTREEVPGGDTIAATILNIKKGTFKLRWPRMTLQQYAKMMGSDFNLTGSTPNQVMLLERKITDIPGYFGIFGRVAYLGAQYPNGDYQLMAYKCQMITSPTFVHETDKVAIYEAEFAVYERSDGKFYDLQIRETGAELTTSPDTNAPAISSITPADNVAGVAITAGSVVIEFDRPIFWDPTQFELQDVVSATAVNVVSTTKSINADFDTVTLAYTSLTTAHNYNVFVSGGVQSRAGVSIAAPQNRQFST